MERLQKTHVCIKEFRITNEKGIVQEVEQGKKYKEKQIFSVEDLVTDIVRLESDEGEELVIYGSLLNLYFNKVDK